MIRTYLLVPFLILISYFCGRAIMLVSGIFPKEKKEFFSSVSCGALVLICISFASHFLTIMRSSLLSDEKMLLGILMAIAVTFLYFSFVIMTFMKAVKSAEYKSSDKKKNAKKKYDKASVCAIILAVTASVICLSFVSSGYFLNTEGDETLETVVSFLDKGSMFSVDPLKGSAYAEGLPLRHKILCLPGFYAVLSSAFKIEPELLVYHIMPSFWFFAGLCGICSLSSAFFSEGDSRYFKRAVFVLFSILFIFGTALSPYSQGFGILSQMYTGGAIRCLLLIPFMLSLLFRKKYIFALLPVICEAFICRTQYGIGFAAVIYVLFILAHFAGERRQRA